MFEGNKETYIDEFVMVDGMIKLTICIDSRLFRFFSVNKPIILRAYDNLPTIYFIMSLMIIEKLSNARKIFKQFKTHIIKNSKIKKFIQRVKERFYNPDTPNNFMKKHANKYINKLGTLIT